MPSDNQVFHALYEDDSGSVIGLDEVQMIDIPTQYRIGILQDILHVDDYEIRYRAALVLCALGYDNGLYELEHLVDIRIDKQGVSIPNRIYGYNNIFDVFANAVNLYSNKGRNYDVQKRLYKKMLSLYGDCIYQSHLKSALLNCNYIDLLSDVVLALKRSLRNSHEYLASQLLPVIARWNQKIAYDYIPIFINDAIQTPNPVCNIAESLRFIEPRLRGTMLEELTMHPDDKVANEAKAVILEL